jgi:predicted  nucleic acid-binding Zn-ribbon protein
MKVCAHHLVALLFAAVLCTPAFSQRHNDPLNPEEIDQLRDTAIEPEKRMKLFVAFARARLVALEQMRSDPKTADRARQTHQLLQEFVTIYDELNDNLENFDDRKADLRKAIKTVIEGDTEFQAKLRALKDDPRASKDEAAEYQFILSNAIESVDSSAEDHRKVAAEQEEVWKHRKKEKQ